MKGHCTSHIFHWLEMTILSSVKLSTDLCGVAVILYAPWHWGLSKMNGWKEVGRNNMSLWKTVRRSTKQFVWFSGFVSISLHCWAKSKRHNSIWLIKLLLNANDTRKPKATVVVVTAVRQSYRGIRRSLPLPSGLDSLFWRCVVH